MPIIYNIGNARTHVHPSIQHFIMQNEIFDSNTVEPLNADTFETVIKCPDYQGVFF